LAAEGQLEAILVYAPDRLSRKYAYQILLIEEFARNGVETPPVSTIGCFAARGAVAFSSIGVSPSNPMRASTASFLAGLTATRRARRHITGAAGPIAALRRVRMGADSIGFRCAEVIASRR
jgi:hypothetical protein